MPHKDAEARRAYYRQYEQKHRKRKNEQARKRYQRDREQRRIYSREQYAKHVETKRAYHLKHQDKIRAKAKKRRLANREKIVAAKRAAYWLDVEVSRARERDRYASRREKHLADCRAHYRAHKAEALARVGNRRAKMGATPEELRKVEALYRKVRSSKVIICHYCGKPVPRKMRHLDHVIPLCRGGRHAVENLVPACGSCNWKKSRRTGEEFKSLLRRAS